MPGINVSALNGADLRRLLKVAHDRHDGLLADRLEWEIAARRTRIVRPAGAFATLPEDDVDGPVDAESFTPDYPVLGQASRPRGALLVTAGVVAGSLLSATVLWGLERMDRLPSFGWTDTHPTRAMTVRSAPPPAAPAPEQRVAVAAPAPLPPPPEPVAPQVSAPEPPPAMIETALPAATPPVEVVRKAAPAPKKVAQKKQLAEAGPKKVAAPKREAAAKAESPRRPPTLDEWLAQPSAR